MHRELKKLAAIFLLIFGLLAWPAEIYATACNSAGCFAAKVTLIKVGADGKLWFVVDNSAQLTNLVPADGCVLKNVWTGQAEPALFITTSDPDRDEKYAILLMAMATGSTIGFSPIKETASGWCSVKDLSIR